MRTSICLLTIILCFAISCGEDDIPTNTVNQEEIKYSIDNVFGRHLREITVFPYEIKYYEKLWNGSLEKYIETKRTKNLSSEDWTYLINSIDTNEFYNLDSFYYDTTVADTEVYSIEIKMNTKVKKVSYETLDKINVIKPLHTKLFELLGTFN